MRAFGYFVLVIGVIALIASMNMDVSVSTGMGRVNNLGLMSQRQNFTTVSGLVALAGLLMVIFGGSKSPAAQTQAPLQQQTFDTRPCPFCAEPIKRAAVKCKHCGSDVEAVAGPIEAETPALRFGWVARVVCSDDETRERVTASMKECGFPVVEMAKVGGVGAGAFEKRDAAVAAVNLLEERFGYAATVLFRDKVSGDYT